MTKSKLEKAKYLRNKYLHELKELSTKRSNLIDELVEVSNQESAVKFLIETLEKIIDSHIK